MRENKQRLLTVSGAVFTALSIALSLLAFVAINVGAATGTEMPSVSDIIPGEDGTSALTLPEGGNVDSEDALTPDDTTRTPAATVLPDSTARPNVTNAPGSTDSPSGTSTPDGTDTGMLEEEGGGIMGAIIAVIVVVAIILVVIALIPRKKR